MPSINSLSDASVPLRGPEVFPVVQDGQTRKISLTDIRKSVVPDIKTVSANYIVQADDAGLYLRATVPDITFTFYPQTDIAWASNSEINIYNGSDGYVNFVLGTNVVFNSKPGQVLSVPSGCKCHIKRINIDIWDFTVEHSRFAEVVIIEESTVVDKDHVGCYLRVTSTPDIDITVGDDSSVEWEIGDEIHIRNAGAGDVNLVAGVDVILNAPSGGTLSLEPRMTVTIKKVLPNEWDVVGQTIPE